MLMKILLNSDSISFYHELMLLIFRKLFFNQPRYFSLLICQLVLYLPALRSISYSFLALLTDVQEMLTCAGCQSQVLQSLAAIMDQTTKTLTDYSPRGQTQPEFSSFSLSASCGCSFRGYHLMVLAPIILLNCVVLDPVDPNSQAPVTLPPSPFCPSTLEMGMTSSSF